MITKITNFLEAHAEKMVWAVVMPLCIWLLITRVLISPNYIEYDNKKFAPREIDSYILRQGAEHLRYRLNEEPKAKEPYEPRLDEFVARLASAIWPIDAGLYWPQPSNSSVEISDGRVYDVPVVGGVNDVSVEHIRAVAYLPIEEIDEENVYDKLRAGDVEPNDIDFVTVEARLDVAQLYERFNEGFAGEDVKKEWRDPCLAQPIFAAVQLQRQEQLADGSWSDWQIAPRTRIDAHRQLFEVIEDVEKLPPGEMKVRLLQFDDAQVKMDLLQPMAYRIASAEEEWFPPSLHKQYMENQKAIEAQERRKRKIAEKEQRQRKIEEARAERSKRTQRAKTTSTGGLGSELDMFMEREMIGGFGASAPGRGGQTRRSYIERKREKERAAKKSRRQVKKGRGERGEEVKVERDSYDELKDISITRKTDFSKMTKPLVFWAHDDTVEPAKSYRYRIRFGVFNPIAGTDKFTEHNKHLKNKVILWSGFSQVTETVEIPGILYFFPTYVQKDAKTVTVQVLRFALGYWYSKDFRVEPGEVIGEAIASETVDSEDKIDEITVPEVIDYATEAILVDVIPVNDWSSGKNMKPRPYHDMLYSFDGATIEHIPVKQRYWAGEVQAKFGKIKELEKRLKKPLRAWGSRLDQRRQYAPAGMDFEELGREEDFMRMMMKGRR